MLKSRLSRNVVIVGLLVVCIFAGTLFGQSPANNELLKMIPAKSLFCVRVNNFDYTLNQTDQFLAGVSPMPMGVSMLVRMHLANLLGSPQLTGLNTNGSFAVFSVTMPGQTAQPDTIPNVFVGIMAPVTDYKQFIEGNTNCTEGDEKGISKITMNGAPVMLSAKAGNYALISWANDYDKLVTMAKSISDAKAAGLSSILNTDETKQAQTEPIWAYGNVQQVSETFGTLISAKIEEIKTIAKSMPAGTSGASPESIQNIMNMYSGILDVLMKETKSVSIGISPKPDTLNITETISAAPGTDMAKMLTADTTSQRENTLLTYLQDGAVANFGATINTPFWRTLNVRGIDIFAAMAGGSISADNIKEMKALATEIIDSVEGPVAYSVSSDAKNKPPFAVKYLIAVKDENRFNQIIEKATDIMKTSGIMDFYKSMGMETSFSMEKAVDSYKGVSINSAKLTMKASDTTSPQAQMINSMYGEGFDYRWGMVNGLFACAVSGDVNSTIRELIDEVKADGPKQIGSEMKAALSLLPEGNKADFVLTFNVLRFFNMVTSMVPIPIPPMDAQTKNNIVIAGSAADSKMVVNVAVPKQHLTEIMAAFMAMQQKSRMTNQ
ncbi:MAG: hypothetical protein JW837_08375 [Sedimentisphaerales bacterium]|nr:hypothetical protein [Sedimentisphaerales bacterium]